MLQALKSNPKPTLHKSSHWSQCTPTLLLTNDQKIIGTVDFHIIANMAYEGNLNVGLLQLANSCCCSGKGQFQKYIYRL